MNFNVETAKQYAEGYHLEEWLTRYLSVREWANEGLAKAVQSRKGLWVGPVEIEVSKLRRSAGPENQSTHPYIVWARNVNEWETEVSHIERGLTDNLLLPPLIVRCEKGNFGIQDGNRRFEAIKRKGWATCWALIEYDNEEDKMRYAF